MNPGDPITGGGVAHRNDLFNLQGGIASKSRRLQYPTFISILRVMVHEVFNRRDDALDKPGLAVVEGLTFCFAFDRRHASLHYFSVGLDELFRGFRDDCIAVTMDSSHSGGSAINQRGSAGFNWPPLSIPAEDPVSISPEAVNRAGWPPARFTACSFSGRPFLSIVFWLAFPPFQSLAEGVAQLARVAAPSRSMPPMWVGVDFIFGPPLDVLGVGHPLRGCGNVEALADVRGTEARSAKIERPDGVVLRFQVRLNNVEPSESVLWRNLFAKDRYRLSRGDEPEPLRPKMSVVSNAFLFPRDRERLAWAGAGPDPAIIGPSGKPEGIAPNCNARKEMALPVGAKVVGLDIFNGSFIDFSRGNQVSLDQFPQTRGFLWVDLVVVGEWLHLPMLLFRSWMPLSKASIRSVTDGPCSLLMDAS